MGIKSKEHCSKFDFEVARRFNRGLLSMFESRKEENEKFKSETNLQIREMERDFENEIIHLERLLKSALKGVLLILFHIILNFKLNRHK